MSRSLPVLGAATCALAALLSAQSSHESSHPPPKPAHAERAATALAADLLVPIHTAADDEGGEYGTWAVGPDYKASFHDGFAFYPVLGDAYPRNLPWRWRTVAVHAGGHELVERAATALPHQEAWRYEYRYPGFVEAYDVGTRGVEQSFVIAQRPAVPGDLVITGAVTTELACPPVANAHAALVFCAARGAPLVRYGAATALDAAGRTCPVTTSFTAGRLSLRVDGAWLAEAAFPVTVDPLTSRVPLDSVVGATRFVSLPTIARDDSTPTYTVGVSFGRISSGTDYDTFFLLTTDTFATPVVVYTDVAVWDSRTTRCAFVGGTKKWVVVQEREFFPPNVNCSAPDGTGGSSRAS